jgi:putative heme iron utilization protein
VPIKKSDAIVHTRQLVRAGRSAALSTILSTNDGWPYTSFVTYATDQSCDLIFLFSDISGHTCNLKADPRVSVLVEHASGFKNPQTGPRVTLLGKIKKTKDANHINRFLTCHPRAEMYAGFTDFNFYHMRVERTHYIGGFASAVWHKGEEYHTTSKLAQHIKEAEADILAHMNADHADAIDLFANKLLRRKGYGWKMIGIDADGIDLIKNERLARLAFTSPLTKASDARALLITLVSKARF